jgi:hypothetical protein
MTTGLITGDKTYEARVERVEYIKKRRADTPQPTLKQIGKELGISKQNVSRLLKRPTVRPAGRQPSNEGRKRRLVKRLGLWQSRRNFKLSEGRDVTYEDGWIATLEARLKDLS